MPVQNALESTSGRMSAIRTGVESGGAGIAFTEWRLPAEVFRRQSQIREMAIRPGRFVNTATSGRELRVEPTFLPTGCRSGVLSGMGQP